MTARLHVAVAAALAVSFAASFSIAPAAAQSITVFGTGEAHACYQAALLSDTSRSAIESCTYALDHESLRRRDRAATLVNRGIVHASRKDYQMAFDDYASAHELMPRLPEIYLNRGNVYFYAERWSEAIADYDTALERGLRQEHVALLNRGMAREFSGDLAGAEADYVRALEVSPDWGQARQKLDRVHEKMNGA